MNRRFELTLEDTGDPATLFHRLRAVLKRLLRCYGFRCRAVTEANGQDLEPAGQVVVLAGQGGQDLGRGEPGLEQARPSEKDRELAGQDRASASDTPQSRPQKTDTQP